MSRFVKQKLPNFIHAKGGSLMAFAGLWSIWENPDPGKMLEMACMLTTQPNELERPTHDRMPVILRLDDYSTWLDTDSKEADLRALLKPYPADLMEAWFVAQRVNKETVERPELVQPRRLDGRLSQRGREVYGTADRPRPGARSPVPHDAASQ